MPQAIPAAVAFVATAFSSAVAVVSGTLTAIGVTAVIGEGAAIALAGGIIKTAGLLALSTASAALMRPSTPSSGSALDFKPDPKAPVRGLMGYHATGGNKVFQSTWGYNGVALSMGVALSLGPIDTITRFEADNSAVSFFGPQGEASGFYNRDMWQLTSKGLPTDNALQIPTGFKYETPHISDWGPSNAAKGVAFAFWTLVTAKNPEDREVFTNGVPDPRWIGRWMKVYDWRKDSTYPGGSGSQREDDWRTWEWSENPYVHARAWLRGHFKMNDDGTLDRQKLIAGVGVGPDSIDMPAFTEAANIADANAWKISGEWSTTDDKAQVLFAMMQAGSGRVIPRGDQISVMVNAPRVSTYTVTRDDVLGQASIRPLTRRRERKNTIVPRYRSEAHNWEYVAAKDVTSSVYRAEDRGEPRSTEIQYTYVREPKQAAELAAYDLVNLREGLSITIPAKVHLMHVHPGDCITVNVPEMALANQKVIVLRSGFDAKSGVATLECRSETDGKHAFAMGQIAEPPPSPSLSAVDPAFIPPPLPEDWDVVVKPPSSDGTSQPIIIVTGPIDRGDIASTIAEWSISPTGPWVGSSPIDPSTGEYQITGLESGGTYYVSLRYVANNGTISERYITGPHVVAVLSSGISDETLDQIVEEVSGQIDGDIAAGKEALDRSRANALLILQNAKNALDGTLKEEKDRETQTGDLQDRLDISFLIDPIAKTGIIRSNVVVQGLGETLVQLNTRLVARDESNALQTAQVAIDAQAYTNQQLSIATANLVTAAQMGAAISGAVLSMEAYADNEIAQATAGLVAVAQMNAAISASSLALQTWTDGRISEATAGLATTAAVATSIAAADLALRSYTDGKVATATAGLATVSQVDTKIDSATVQLQSYTNGQIGNATATLATKTELAGVSATAGLAVSTANTADGKINAAISLLTNVDGLITGLFSYNDGATGTVNILSSVFNLYSTGSGAQTSYIDGVWYVLDPDLGTRTMWGKPFGGGEKLQWWTGPNSVPIFGETKANAYVFISMTAPRFGGSDVPINGFHAQANFAVRTGSRTSAGLVTTSAVTIVATGATGTVTYAWSQIGGDDEWTVVTSDGPTTTFRVNVATPGEIKRAQFACLVTDTGSGRSFTIIVGGAAIYNI